MTGVLSAVALGLLVGTLPVAVLWLVTEPVARHFPGGARTLEDLVRVLVRDHPAPSESPAAADGVDQGVVWNRLAHHLARQGHVPVEALRPEMRLWEELRFG